ncbi:MAG TPA: GspE/PulE family protein [Pirellulales bacterium]|nr:GspE/PulE family protein [Pirellulales bacterium]
MHGQLATELGALDPASSAYATRFVEILLAVARRQGASDVHLQPAPAGLELRWRVDGVLSPLGTFPPGAGANVVARLKVLAELLTYRSDVPQEGRIRTEDASMEVRVSTFPTLHGERAVLRLFNSRLLHRDIKQLGLPADALSALEALLMETSGALLVVGPAGSGKTTTLYACLEEVLRKSAGSRSVMTLEDPIEMAVPGAAQSQVHAAAGFDMATALRSLLRQDPEVIMIGEIRDPATAEVALQASLTGQLVLSSFHAGSAAEAVGRLLDMGIEPYVLRSGLQAVLFQRLVRVLCSCAQPTHEPADFLGLAVASARIPVGCDRCDGSGYTGRTIISELLSVAMPGVGDAILRRADVSELEAAAERAGMVNRWARAAKAVEQGITSPREVRRVLGFGRKIAD